MVDPITAGAIALSTKALEKPLNGLLSVASDALKSLAKKWNASGKRDALVQIISEAEKVRTIFSATPIPISDFRFLLPIQSERTSVGQDTQVSRESHTDQRR